MNPNKKRVKYNVKNNCKNIDFDNTTKRKENENFMEKEMEIQVDFEGHNPQDADFHGIKTLLQQLFLKACIDISKLTNLIISQNYIGSVIKQSYNFEDCDYEDDDINSIFSITTVVNISYTQNIPCLQQLRELLKQLSNKYATSSTNNIIKNVLENDFATLGLMINERFVNIPIQITIPVFESLLSEIKCAINKKMPFNFTYYILICKLYKINEANLLKKNKNKQKNITEELNIIWSNPEEEIFAEEAICSFEFSVEKESCNGLSGRWTEDDNEMIPYRRVLLFESSKLQQIINKIKVQI